MNITYEKNGDYLIPNLISDPEPEGELRKFGLMRRHYLKEHRSGIYQAMLLSGKLKEYLLMMQEQAEAQFDLLVKQMAEQEGVTEHLKEKNQMLWVQRCYPAPLVLQIILISVKLNEGTDSDILMFFTAECLNRYLLVLSYQSYKNSRYLPDQSLTPAIITIRCTTTSLDREMLHQRYDNNYSTF